MTKTEVINTGKRQMIKLVTYMKREVQKEN